MIRLGVTGALGRMGSAVIRLAGEDPGFRLVAAFERPSEPRMGVRIADALGLKSAGGVRLRPLKKEFFGGMDVLVDFSEPRASLEAAASAAACRRPIVIGTTGFDAAGLRKLKAAARKTAVLLSPNMSVGANLLFDLAERAARALGAEYDIEVIEAHHCHKKDAPSGTARRLAERLARARGWTIDRVAVYGRRGITGERPKNQIGIHVIRAGGIVGDHTALFGGPEESVALTHQAFSRDAFAKGALLAARFLRGRRKGFYGMSDVLASTAMTPSPRGARLPDGQVPRQGRRGLASAWAGSRERG